MQNDIILIGTELSGLSYMNMLLAQKGYRLTLLRDPHRAEEIIVQQRPSLIIIDDQPDALPALQLCQQLKNNAAIAAIETILLLPYANGQANKVINEACGANVLTKPILPHLLLELVGQLTVNASEEETE